MEAELMCWDRFVDINIHLNSFEEKSFEILDVIGRRLMGLYNVTLFEGLPGL